MYKQLTEEMLRMGDKEKARILQRFFKTGKGEYGEGDIFWGISVPDLRKLAKKYRGLEGRDIEKLLKSKVHEHRLLGLHILVEQYGKGNGAVKERVVNLYLRNLGRVNNWDLVDSSAHQILGEYLMERDRGILDRLAGSDNLWERRIAMMASFAFIKRGEFGETLRLAEVLIHDKHDLIQKAVGWMLREVGNRDLKAEEEFLDKYAAVMPRTMLRYAIEKFEEKKRQFYLKKI